MAILDASAIAIILKRLRAGAVKILVGEATLDLAAYELGNVIWKEYSLDGDISPEEASETAEHIARILQIMERLSAESAEDLGGAMRLATGLKVTFYDAAYLHHARGRQPLVTEDRELREKARGAQIETMTVDQFLEASPR